MISKKNMSNIISALGVPAIVIENKDNQYSRFHKDDDFNIHYIDHNALKFNYHCQHFTNDLETYRWLIKSGDIYIVCQKKSDRYQYQIAIEGSNLGTTMKWENLNQHHFLQETLKKWDAQADQQSWSKYNNNSFHYQLKYMQNKQEKLWIKPDKLAYLIIIYYTKILGHPYKVNTINELFQLDCFATKIIISHSIKRKKNKNFPNALIRKIISPDNNIKYKHQFDLKHFPYKIISYHLSLILRCSLNVMIGINPNREFMSATIKLSFSTNHHSHGVLEMEKSNDSCMRNLDTYDNYLKKQIGLKNIGKDTKYTMSRPNHIEEYNEYKHHINIECRNYHAYRQILTLISSKIFKHLSENQRLSRETCRSLPDILLSFVMIATPYCKVFTINIPSIELSLLKKENLGKYNYFRKISSFACNTNTNNTQYYQGQCHYFRRVLLDSSKKNHGDSINKKAIAFNTNDNAVKLITYLFYWDSVKNTSKILLDLLNMIYQFANDGYNMHHLLMGPGFFGIPQSNDNHHANDDLTMTHHVTTI